MNIVPSFRGEIPWYAAVLGAWRQRGDTTRDALWAGAAWAASAVEFAREHPHEVREIARLQDIVLVKVSEDAAAVLLVINWRQAERERQAKLAPASDPATPADRGHGRTRERQWLIPR